MGRKSQMILSCPTAKRETSRPVAFQGWLLKRGSDGLMLWKRRWFVLSDFCLFYYKDTLEEKLLGSLILASYQISKCSPEEKGYRKFSFKAEHANMRTYYFAAENQTLMDQWIKAMTLASLLQEHIGEYEGLSGKEIGRARKSYYRKAQRDVSEGPKRNEDNAEGEAELEEAMRMRAAWHKDRLEGADVGTDIEGATPQPYFRTQAHPHQPLYANAPPKPKRLNESSPECSPDIPSKEECMQDYQHQSYPVIYNNIGQSHYCNGPSPRKLKNYNITHSGVETLNTSKNVSFTCPPRPHSVDFLEYAGKKSPDRSKEYLENNKLNNRPKSSLSRVCGNEDSSWTAEEYARRMRESSVFVNPIVKQGFLHKPQPLPGGTNTPPKLIDPEKQSIINSVEIENEKYPGVLHRAKTMINAPSSADLKFSRSASARLCRLTSEQRNDNLPSNSTATNNHPSPSSTTSHYSSPQAKTQKKLYQREEAMKRLLEWKNRMTNSSLRKCPRKDGVSEDERSYGSGERSDGMQGMDMIRTRTETSPRNGMDIDVHLPVKDPTSFLPPRDKIRNSELESRASDSPFSGPGLHHPSLFTRAEKKNFSPSSPSSYLGSSDDEGLETFESKGGGPEKNNSLADQRNLFSKGTNKVTNDCADLTREITPAFDPKNADMKTIFPENAGSTEQLHKKTNLNNLLHLRDFNNRTNLSESIGSDREDEEWRSKLDESQVIKEFSYHYITTEENEVQQSKNNMSKNRQYLSSQCIPNMITPNFSIPDNSQEKLTGRIPSAGRKQTGEKLLIQKGINKFQKSNAAQKTYNDIVTTTESGVKTFREESNNLIHLKGNLHRNFTPDGVDRRLIQSDSEALQHDDMSIKIEGKASALRNSIDKELSTDEDRDEEVAAVLGKEDHFSKTAFESVKSPLRNYSSSNHEFSPNNLDREHLLSQSSLICHEKTLSASTDVNSDIQEENYIPMTPKKKSNSELKDKISHCRSDSSSYSTIIENFSGSPEESPYVEMTQNKSRKSNLSMSCSIIGNQSLKNDCSLSSCIGKGDDYSESGKSNDMEYELINNKSKVMVDEPVYMELPMDSAQAQDQEKANQDLLLPNDHTLLILNKRKCIKGMDDMSDWNIPGRESLPDILSMAVPGKARAGSDSSDADDEASKDLESLDAPRHPRFSLSDTFRPASYYLGSSLTDRTIIPFNNENQDSSDSDLVSPPPIPNSSPPIDELETSIESTILNKEQSLHNKTDSSSLFLADGDRNEMISPFEIKSPLRNPSFYEASSEESINYGRREKRMKRRPLSADILRSLQNMNFSDDEQNDQSNLANIYAKGKEEQGDSDVENNRNLQLTNYLIYDLDVCNTPETGPKECEENTRYKDIEAQRGVKCESFLCSQTSTRSEIIEMRNQYENFQINKASYKLNDKCNCKDNNSSILTEAQLINETNDTNSRSIEHKNNAPYYYSDILKTEKKKNHNFDNSQWKEQVSSDCEKSSATYKYVVGSNGKILSQTLNKDIINNEDIHSSKESVEFFKDQPISETYSHKNDNIAFMDCRAPHGPQRTRSLEGLLDNPTHPSSDLRNDFLKNVNSLKQKTVAQKMLKNVGQHSEDSKTQPPSQDIWEEDTLWRENLRKVSLRQSRSLEDLDRKDTPHGGTSQTSSNQSDSKTYENLTSYGTGKPMKESQQLYPKMNFNSKFKFEKMPDGSESWGSDKGEIKGSNRPPEGASNWPFELDREKLRQWDLMSTGPSKVNSSNLQPNLVRNNHNLPQGQPSPANSASAIRTTPTPFLPDPSTELELRTKDASNSHLDHPKNDQSSQTELLSPYNPQDQEQTHPWNLKVSAGELLGRTHEELVLLLIQLRRQRAAVCQSMEKCHREIETTACLVDRDKANRIEHLQKLDELKAKLADFEKQYEKGKPLVNLVDNMVKLGSLYQAGSPQKIEFIQRIQEQRLLAEEKRDWERIRPDRRQLKAKVDQLYRLDKLLQEESGTLHSLQQDKGVLERALGGVRNKLQGIHGNSPETEWYKRQQRLLEKELSRVRSILALNSKKLEETVAENARLEQELVVLRQKLQLSRRSAEPGSTNTASLEAQLARVQSLVGNLLRQRQELSQQVRQLTEKSNSLSQQMWTHSPYSGETGTTKKPWPSTWIETDLDVEQWADTSNILMSPINDKESLSHYSAYSSPLYVNTTDREGVDSNGYQDDYLGDSPLSVRSPELTRTIHNNEDDSLKQTCGLHQKEKPQEIKTVRIVKRESERRQRDRDRIGNIGIPITYISSKRPINDDRLVSTNKLNNEIEDRSELDYKSNDLPPIPGPRTDSVNAVWNLVKKNKIKGKLECRSVSDKSDSISGTPESPQLSPVYLSETARKIVEEVAWQGMSEKRLIPKEKRKHHTMSGPSLMAPKNLFSQAGSRDDLDLERVLRPRLSTPDVVRSTFIRVDPHYTKETIDNILGAPGKILIPERYIPESQPQLSEEEQHRRLKKADAIRKMLCETSTVSPKEPGESGNMRKTSTLKQKVAEEKKNREHLLQLSQILAQQVMEKSKLVAVMAIASLPTQTKEEESESDEEYSSFENLPLYQKRENYFS